MIALLQEERIKDYDVLVIQESWRHGESSKTYNPRSAGFTLEDNGGRTCFYINNRIDSNSWHADWQSKDVGTITLLLRADDTGATSSLHVHGVYNPPPTSHNETRDKGNLPYLQTALRRGGESIIVGDFNLHHPSWAGPSYPRQHQLADDLLDITGNANAMLALLRGTITRNYQEAKTTIDLAFATNEVTERLIYCGVDEEIENESDHLPIRTVLDLKTQEEPERPPRRN